MTDFDNFFLDAMEYPYCSFEIMTSYGNMKVEQVPVDHLKETAIPQESDALGTVGILY